jgi:hypothetical protein
MLYEEEFILSSNSIDSLKSLFRKYSVIVAIWDNFLGLKYKLK